MTNTLTIGHWVVEYDQDATARCYASLSREDLCDCTACRNFVAAIDQAFPTAVQDLAVSFGIDLTKSANLDHYDIEPSGLIFTGAIYHVVGRVTAGYSGVDALGYKSGDSVALTDEINIFFAEPPILVPDDFPKEAVIQLEFTTYVPWVINEPEFE